LVPLSVLSFFAFKICGVKKQKKDATPIGASGCEPGIKKPFQLKKWFFIAVFKIVRN